MINYGNSREVTVHTEPGSKTQSRLTIRDAKLTDTGNYSCHTGHAEPAFTLVYVSQGKIQTKVFFIKQSILTNYL